MSAINADVRQRGDAADKLGVTLDEKFISSSDEVISVMEGIKEGEYDAFFHLGEAKVSGSAMEVIALANKIKLPTIAHAESFAADGMLAAYGPSWYELGRLCASTLDKILSGTAPADIPIQLPASFELIINRSTSRDLGIELSRDAALRVDRFLE